MSFLDYVLVTEKTSIENLTFSITQTENVLRLKVFVQFEESTFKYYNIFTKKFVLTIFLKLFCFDFIRFSVTG